MTDQTEHIARAYSQQSGELRYQLDMLEAQRARLDRVFLDPYAPNLSLNPGVADLLSELLDSIRDVADRTREQVDVLVAAAEVRVAGSGDVARGVGGFAEFSGDVGHGSPLVARDGDAKGRAGGSAPVGSPAGQAS
jgi:hypothetical protein